MSNPTFTCAHSVEVGYVVLSKLGSYVDLLDLVLVADFNCKRTRCPSLLCLTVKIGIYL